MWKRTLGQSEQIDAIWGSTKKLAPANDQAAPEWHEEVSSPMLIRLRDEFDEFRRFHTLAYPYPDHRLPEKQKISTRRGASKEQVRGLKKAWAVFRKQQSLNI
jgi:hypothetical protein